MELWAVAVDATTTTITTTTQAVTTTAGQTSTTLESGANGAGQVPWGVWASVIVTVLFALIAPIVSYVLTRRAEERKAQAERHALLAKEREEHETPGEQA
jgi:multisubunit Na+/H+ antiporter MnhG subunit